MKTYQLNLRLSEKMLTRLKEEVEEYGYDNAQEYIKELLRTDLFEEDLSLEEIDLITKVKDVSDKNSLYGTKEELFNVLNRK